jgi:cytochrome c biogenesis protein ResB
VAGIAIPSWQPAHLPWLGAPWGALTSVRVAALTILLLAAACLAGVLVPQIPPAVMANPAMEAAWLDQQRQSLGWLTPLVKTAGLFDVFHAWWFLVMLAWLAASICACTLNRLPALARQAFRPAHRVPDALFERSSSTALPPVGAEHLQAQLRKRWFRVHVEAEGGAIYLFADRWPWATLGTVLTHLALVLFLVGALVSKLDGFSASLAIAEGRSAPLYAAGDPDQIVVRVDSATGVIDSLGRPLDFRTDVALIKHGEVAKQCSVTVNGPCTLDGVRFHQAGFFGYGVELSVRDAESGALLYREPLPLKGSLDAARIHLTGRDGRVIYDGLLPETLVSASGDGALVALGDHGRRFWMDLQTGERGWWIEVVDLSDGDAVADTRALIREGDSAIVGDFTVTFEAVESVPAALAPGVPTPGGAAEGGAGVLLALENGSFGSVLDGQSSAPPILHVAGLSEVSLRLEPGHPVRVGPYEYEFGGQRAFAGIGVRRDRGDEFIWVAGAMFVMGLVTTLWLPRRRAWFRIGPDGESRVYSPGRTQVNAMDLGLERD